MGNLNVRPIARERLKEMAEDDDRNQSNLAEHLINKEWRSRKGYRNEREVSCDSKN